MERPVLGILGGMGGLASAEFVRTVYELSGRRSQQEQAAPVVLMYSDPTFPDRTVAFLRGETEPLLTKLIDSLEVLRRMGATHIVICCMTIHYLLPKVPERLRKQIISLLDVIFSSVERFESLKTKHLVVSSRGTIKLELLQRHPRWEYARNYFVFPSEFEQQRIHELIYDMKFSGNSRHARSYINILMDHYGVDSFVAACSEIHLLAKQYARSGPGQTGRYGCIDPLAIIASHIVEQNRYEA